MLHWDWKKTVSTVLTTLGIGTLTSCYGVPSYSADPALYGYVSSSDRFEKDGIKGIKVTLINKGEVLGTAYTNEKGFYCIDGIGISSDKVYTLEFEDVDGSQNGGIFMKKSTQFYLSSECLTNVVLEKE